MSRVRAEARVLRGLAARLKPFAGPGLGAVLFGAALWGLHRELAQYPYRGVLHSLSSIPGLALGQLAAASTDWALAAGVLYCFLPGPAVPSYPGGPGLFFLDRPLRGGSAAPAALPGPGAHPAQAGGGGARAPGLLHAGGQPPQGPAKQP